MTKFVLAILLQIATSSFNSGIAQSAQKQYELSPDSSTIDYDKIYSFCLDGDVRSALLILSQTDQTKLNIKDQQFKIDFESRFRKAHDESIFLNDKSAVISLLDIYRDYWRASLLNPEVNFDSAMIENIAYFLRSNYLPARQLAFDIDSIDLYTKKYISSLGLYTTGFGKTGKLYDLLVWSSEQDTTYTFTSSNNETTSAEIIFMNDFITLGWEEYATLGRYYPGGWATDEALFCVTKGYDINSEDFLISYLAHESRHFADYQLFPKLSSADLEYRAKLTELSLAKSTLYDLIESFTNNANYESENGHSVANFCVIRDISKMIFKNDFETDLNKWKSIGIEQINSAALIALEKDTSALKKIGADVEKYIKQ